MKTQGWLIALLPPLLGVTALTAQDTKKIGFRDDFAADSRAAYTVTGDVAWDKGGVTLAADAQLDRKVDAARLAELVGVQPQRQAVSGRGA